MISSTRPPNAPPHRGEVWAVQFNPSVGAEIQKLRPAIVVSVPEVGRLPLHIVVPLTDWKPVYNRFPWFVRIVATTGNGLIKDSGADAFQIKSVASARFINQLGNLTAEDMRRIVAAIALCIGFPSA